MNVLMTYRLQAFKTEILPQFEKFKNDNITFIVQSKYSKTWLPILIKRLNLELKINIITIEELLKGKIDNMQFDFIFGNPPYQQITGKTTKPIWDKILIKCYKLLKPSGEMKMIHPSSWRFATNKSKDDIKEVRKIYNENNTNMELHDVLDGGDTFNSGTDYDIVTLIKEPRNRKSKITTKIEKIHLDISQLGVLPTCNYKLHSKLIAKNDESKIKLINNYNYGTDDRFKHTQKTKTSIFKYPVVDRYPESKGIVFIYSSVNSKGHFHIPKLIIPRTSPFCILDLKGEYGMTQFVAAIVDEHENLIRMQKALESSKFRELKRHFCGIGNSNRNAIIDANGHMFKFLKEFKKDFWKEFYTPEMEQELIDEGKIDKEGNLILF